MSNTKNAQNKRQEEFLARKVSLAQERDTRVVITRTFDTIRILDIIRSADRGIKMLRSKLLLRYSAEEVLPLLEKYQDAIYDLHIATHEICLKAGIPYRAPRGLSLPPAEGNGKQARKEKRAEEIMDTVYND